MTNKTLTCRIWAHEESPKGHVHWCHAENAGLSGNSYYKEDIEKILATKLTLGGTWNLVACEPNHNGESCKDCQYSHCKGLSYCHDPKLQRQALMEAVRNGADLTGIVKR
jgi:hypothetical protein